jgi:hypothetical protein
LTEAPKSFSLDKFIKIMSPQADVPRTSEGAGCSNYDGANILVKANRPVTGSAHTSALKQPHTKKTLSFPHVSFCDPVDALASSGSTQELLSAQIRALG